MLQIEKVSKTYHSKGIDYPVLKEITATVHDGEFVAIMGPSGSGKTTLLNVISGFISADGEKVILDGQDILTGEENELAEIRQHKLGFVFQDLLRFYTPIYYLLQKYDMHPELETEAKEELISIVREFCETYKAKD